MAKKKNGNNNGAPMKPEGKWDGADIGGKIVTPRVISDYRDFQKKGK